MQVLFRFFLNKVAPFCKVFCQSFFINSGCWEKRQLYKKVQSLGGEGGIWLTPIGRFLNGG